VIGAKALASLVSMSLILSAGSLRAETVLRCETTQLNGQIREVCALRSVQDAIRVDLPEPASTAVLSADIQPPITLPAPDLPPNPVVAVLPSTQPDLRIPAPNAPPTVLIPGAPLQTAPQIADIPADLIKNALERMSKANRVSDREAAAASAFYKARAYAPLWIADGRWNARAKTLRAALNKADESGLDSASYRTVSAFISTGEPAWPALAAAEINLTEALLAYAREASTGRVAPARVHPLITPNLKTTAADVVLKTLIEADQPADALLAFNPPHAQFLVLRQKLAALRTSRRPVSGAIPDGPLLRVGMRDARVPLIRARLGLDESAELTYDRAISMRIAGVQRSSGLVVNGAFTDATRRALLGEGPSADEAEIIANMERWRWMPRELGTDHIFVNLPELTMRLMRGPQTALQSRIIVGKSDTQTPLFSDEMDHIVVNPSWYVPPGILKRDPRYLDPAWAAARGYEIRHSGNTVSVRVPPSASNALGNVKFMFPNSHAVYLHDTPGRHLFNAQNRTLSNGCVRVENPFRLAAQLFAEQGWTEERFRGSLGRGERHMRLPRKMPIHIGHFTLTVSPDGELLRHTDIYGHSARLRQLLGLS
jgi:L,D-transpeptidase YcbB